MTHAPEPSRPFDPERHARRLAPAGGLLLVVGSCAGGWPGAAVAVVGLGLLLACCYSARDGFLLLGPLTTAELTRVARRRRPWLWRSIYALAAGALILGSIASDAPGLLDLDVTWYSPDTIARINQRVTTIFAVALAAYALVLTVQLVPTVVAEERQAKRWDILLATDLRPREILLGKVAARLVQVFEPTLAVLPVLAVMPLLGGVSPAAVGLFGVALLAVVVSAAAVATFYSVFAPTDKEARSRTNSLLFAYYVLVGIASGLASSPTIGGFPTTVGVPFPVTFADAAGWLATGHPVRLLSPVFRGAAGFEDALTAGLPAFLAFHLAVALLYGLTACGRLRFAEVWVKQSRGDARRVRRAERGRSQTPAAPVVARAATARPPVPDESVEWWARYGHVRGRPGWDILRPRKFAAASFVVVGLAMLAVYPLDHFKPFLPIRWVEGLRMIAPFALWCVTLPLFLRPLFHAAGVIAGERQADTITGLYLTPLTSREIVVQKWRGSVRENTGLYAFLIGGSAAATLTGFLHPLSLPVTAVVALPGVALAGAIGVYFSAGATTAARAKRWTALAVFGGGYLMTLLGAWTLSSLRVRVGDSAAMLLAIPVPPAATFFPMMLGPLTEDKSGVTPGQGRAAILCVMAGVGFQSFAAWLFLKSAVQKFERARSA